MGPAGSENSFAGPRRHPSARLALCDLFMHGIGGARYDRVTDRLIETFFDLAPPGIMVPPATLYLPVERPKASNENLRDIRRELRELNYHPEKYLHAAPLPSMAKRPVESVPWSTKNSSGSARPSLAKTLMLAGPPSAASTVNYNHGSLNDGTNYWNSKRKCNAPSGTRRCSARENMASVFIPNPI